MQPGLGGRPPIRPAWLLAATLGAFAVGAVGCLDIEIAMNHDASGTFRLRPNMPSVRLNVVDLLSPHVHVKSFGEAEGVVSIEGSFDDVTKLPSARMFRDFAVRRERMTDTVRLRVVYWNPSSRDRPQARRADLMRIPVNVSISFPGPVRFANRGAEIAGTRAVWRIPLWALAGERSVKLSARYAVEAPAAGGPPTT